MSGEYQLRKDVDKIIDDIYDIDYKTLKVVKFNENSPLREKGVHVDDEGNYIDVGTLDTILEALGLMDIEERFRKLVLEDLLDKTYPIGSIYMSVDSTSPSLLFGGTWEQLTDTFLYATSTTADANSTTAPTGQGEETHTLTESEMPSHTHTQNAHNHTPTSGKYVAVESGINVALTSKRNMSYTSGSYYYMYSSTTGGVGEHSNTASTTATNQNKGGGQAHNNMPPYMKVYMWKRTA